MPPLRAVHFKIDALPSICYLLSGHSGTMPLSCTLSPAFHRVFFATVDPGYYLYESVRWFLIALPSRLACLDLPVDCRIIRRSTNINCQGVLTPAMAIDAMFSSLVRGFHTLPLVRSQTWRELSDFDLSTCTAELTPLEVVHMSDARGPSENKHPECKILHGEWYFLARVNVDY
jgi:hypothetical protein